MEIKHSVDIKAPEVSIHQFSLEHCHLRFKKGTTSVNQYGNHFVFVLFLEVPKMISFFRFCFFPLK